MKAFIAITKELAEVVGQLKILASQSSPPTPISANLPSGGASASA
jgi:hypothetical protein